MTLLAFLLSSITGLVGGYLGLKVLAYPLSWVFRGCQEEGAIGCIIFGAALGAAIGLGLTVGIAQWFILRRIVQRSLWWIFASVLGWCGIFFSLTVMVYLTTPALGSPEFKQPGIIAQLSLAERAIAPVILAGALMGLFQWLILRSSLRQSWWWVPAHAFMMLLGGLGVYLQEYTNSSFPSMRGFIVIFSLIYAVLSGSLLNWLVEHSRNPVTT